MSNVLTQTIVYVVLLFAGYGFKKAGIFKVEDTDFLKKVILYLTMPAMAVNGLKDLELQPSFLWCFLAGFGTSTILMLVGMAATRKKSPEEKVMYLFNLNTYNIGNFAIPFLTGLLSTDGFAALCLFDIGVAIYLYGIDYSLAEAVKGGKSRFSLKFLLKKIFTSPITDMYLLMILLSALHLRLPEPILKLASVMGNANAFLAMLSIGILFELKLDKNNLKDMMKFLPCGMEPYLLSWWELFFLSHFHRIYVRLSVYFWRLLWPVLPLFLPRMQGGTEPKRHKSIPSVSFWGLQG